MSWTSASTIRTRSGSRPHTLGARGLLAWTLVCCAWFAASPRAWAIDRERLTAQDRQSAARDWKQARTNLAEARAEAASARQRLREFLSRHFESPHDPGRPLQAQPLEPRGGSIRGPDPQLAQLKTQLEELREQRLQLLEYLTAEHPQVLDLDERIAVVQRQIGSLVGNSTAPDQRANGETAVVENRWTDNPIRPGRQREQGADEYRRLYDAWQLSEFALDRATRAEAAAAARLEVIALSDTATTEAVVAGQQAVGATADGPVERNLSFPTAEQSDGTSGWEERATAAHELPSDAGSAGSQPLALAALLIALAVAGLVAVRLARSTADPLFASADEVAAALAIPVVGIIPATAARLQRNDSDAGWRRRWILLGEILMAILVFCVTVCILQDPGGLWQIFAYPLEALSSLVQATRGGN